MTDSHKAVKHPSFFLREKTTVGLFNHYVSVSLGKILGSIYFFYFCVLLDLIELPAVIKSNDTIAWITYVAQTVIQLLALPILQVYQNIIQEYADAKAAADHMALTHIATQVDKILARQ